MFRKLLCVAPQSAVVPASGRADVEMALSDSQPYLPARSPERGGNHYHPRPVATLSEAERQRMQLDEEQDNKKRHTSTVPNEMDSESPFSLHVALGRVLVVASLAVGEQPSVTLVKGHLQLIDEYGTMANQKRKGAKSKVRQAVIDAS